MNVALAVFAGVAVAGAVLAVSSRDVRAAVLGLLIVFLAAPLISNPWPDPPAILGRVAAALLAARLLTIGLRGAEVTVGTRIGWPAEALAGIAAAVIAFGSHGLGAAALGPAEAQAAGFALIALGMAPLLSGRDVLRIGLGAVLLVIGAVLVRVGLDATPGDGEQLVVSLLTIGLGGAVGAIAAAARAAGGLEIANVPSSRRPRRPPDAHRAEPTSPAAAFAPPGLALPGPGAQRRPTLPGLPRPSLPRGPGRAGWSPPWARRSGTEALGGAARDADRPRSPRPPARGPGLGGPGVGRPGDREPSSRPSGAPPSSGPRPPTSPQDAGGRRSGPPRPRRQAPDPRPRPRPDNDGEPS
ncbi:MAG TPA: hypothetical protein VHS36_10320 [Candidatus Limnocylindrales bacterium]|nr:hypothetical protein [Candidatus Limnocylindrales bacterium]